jgi:hypothetical protein
VLLAQCVRQRRTANTAKRNPPPCPGLSERWLECYLSRQRHPVHRLLCSRRG